MRNLSQSDGWKDERKKERKKQKNPRRHARIWFRMFSVMNRAICLYNIVQSHGCSMCKRFCLETNRTLSKFGKISHQSLHRRGLVTDATIKLTSMKCKTVKLL